MAEAQNVRVETLDAEKRELKFRIEQLEAENFDLKRQIEMDKQRAQIADAAYEDIKHQNEILMAQMDIVYLFLKEDAK